MKTSEPDELLTVTVLGVAPVLVAFTEITIDTVDLPAALAGGSCTVLAPPEASTEKIALDFPVHIAVWATSAKSVLAAVKTFTAVLP